MNKWARGAVGLALSFILAVVVGCDALGDRPEVAGPGNGLETTHVRVSTTVVVDVAPLLLARDGGYFQKEGLTVDIIPAENPGVSLNKAISGDVDIAGTTFTQMVITQSKGVADLKIIADAASAKPKSNAIVVTPNSPVKSMNDLAGKRIGISSENATSQVLTKSLMFDHGVPFGQVQWTPIAFPNVPDALKRGDLDAAYLPEPFLTRAAKVAGAVPLMDASTGATEDFPLLGYAGTGKWVQAHPKAMAAFQRAMKAATIDANMHRERIEPLIAAFTKTDTDTVSVMTMPNLHSVVGIDPMKRVPDLLVKLGILPTLVDVTTMIAPQG